MYRVEPKNPPWPPRKRHNKKPIAHKRSKGESNVLLLSDNKSHYECFLHCFGDVTLPGGLLFVIASELHLSVFLLSTPF